MQAGAITLAEAANLLMIPGRRVARPGEKSETPGVELEPEEMDALIAKDRAAWDEHAKALYDAAMLACRAAEAKDADKVFELGETIEHACENCHQQLLVPERKDPGIAASHDHGIRLQGGRLYGTNTTPHGRSPTFTRAFTVRLVDVDDRHVVRRAVGGEDRLAVAARRRCPTAARRLRSTPPACSSPCR